MPSLAGLHSREAFFNTTAMNTRNLAAEEFSFSTLGLMAGWIAGFVSLLSVACILWARSIS